MGYVIFNNSRVDQAVCCPDFTVPYYIPSHPSSQVCMSCYSTTLTTESNAYGIQLIVVPIKISNSYYDY